MSVVGAAHSSWPDAYCAATKVPWLEALVAWKTGGTRTGSCEFSQDRELHICACIEDKPFYGNSRGSYLTGPMHTDWRKRDVWNEVKRGWRFAAQDDPMVALKEPPNKLRPVMFKMSSEHDVPAYSAHINACATAVYFLVKASGR